MSGSAARARKRLPWPAFPLTTSAVAAATSAGRAGAIEKSGSPASWNSTAGARSHSPRHGLRTAVTSVPSSEARISSPPNGPHATSSHTCTTRGACGSVANIA